MGRAGFNKTIIQIKVNQNVVEFNILLKPSSKFIKHIAVF